MSERIQQLEKKVSRLEAINALNRIQNIELYALLINVLTSPGEYTNVQIARAFDHLENKQTQQSLRAYEMMKAKYPLPDDTDIRTELGDAGVLTAEECLPIEDQLEFEFPELENLGQDEDLDLFNEEPPEEF